MYQDLKFRHVDLDKPTLVLIDNSVAMHRFDQSLAGIDHKDPRFIPLLKANMTALANCSWLPSEVFETVARVIFTVDVKRKFKYWRHDWLLDPHNYLRVERKRPKVRELRRQVAWERWQSEGLVSEAAHKEFAINYKAGRSLPGYRFKKISTNVLNWLSSDERPLGARGIGEPYYESDDFMGAIVSLNRAKGSPYNIIIYTVDCDLMGLIDTDVTWVCMSGHSPGIRDTLDVCNIWGNTPNDKGEVKLGHIDTWRDVWVRKGEVGDKADSLPPSNGVLIPVIDLFAPPEEYNLLNKPSTRIAINNLIAKGSPPDAQEAARAIRYIISTGTVPTFKSYVDCPVTQPNQPVLV